MEEVKWAWPLLQVHSPSNITSLLGLSSNLQRFVQTNVREHSYFLQFSCSVVQRLIFFYCRVASWNYSGSRSSGDVIAGSGGNTGSYSYLQERAT